jgi:hypothetical protein
MRSQLVVAFLVVGLAAPTAAIADVQASPSTFELVRTTTGPATLQLEFQASISDKYPTAFEGSFAGRLPPKGPPQDVVSLGARLIGTNDEPVYSSNGRTTRICPQPTSCALTRSFAYGDVIYLDDQGGADALNRFWIVTRGDFTIRLKGHGWKLVPTGLNYRYITSTQASRFGVYAGTDSAEISRDVSLSGGRRGSLAVLMPPCSTSSDVPAAEPVPRGVGSMTLGGGPHPSTLSCPASVGKAFPTDVARAATTWTVTGTVLGDSSFQAIRLLVVDL